MKDLYLQLFSLGDAGRGKTTEEQLAIVKEMGYAGVEFFGGNFGTVTDGNELKELLEKYELGCRSGHFSMDNIEAGFPVLQAIGGSYAIISTHPFCDRAEAMELAGLLNEKGKKAAEYGLMVGYHNHATEFNRDGDDYLLEILIQNTDPQYVMFQMDAGHAAHAGIDVYYFTRKYADRIKAIHLKEWNKIKGPGKANSMKDPVFHPGVAAADGKKANMPDPEVLKKMMEERRQMNCAAGQGTVDWNYYAKVVKEAGIEPFFINERPCSYNTPEDRIACLKEDFKYYTEKVID